MIATVFPSLYACSFVSLLQVQTKFFLAVKVFPSCSILSSPSVIWQTMAFIPGFKNVQLRDIIMQPGSKTMGPPMMNAMVCHITEGERRSEQEGKPFTAKKNLVWTCNKDTKEQAYNDGNVVGIMRITDLMA